MRRGGQIPVDLEAAIAEIRLVDTHEHLVSEEEWVERGPDILQDLFHESYAAADLLTAGASRGAVADLLDPSAGRVEDRFAAVEDAWRVMRLTGYGETVRLIGREVYGIEELTPATIGEAEATLLELRRPGEMLRLLREQAHLDHVQIDDGLEPPREATGPPEFFRHDLTWYRLSNGDVDQAELHDQTGIEVRGLEDLRAAIARIFVHGAPEAVAVKTQHAYNRTLRWRKRSDEEAERALAAVLAGSEVGWLERWEIGDLSGGGVDEADRLVLGDWCLARGVELASEHGLPIKIHTGYYSANGRMPLDRIAAGNLAELIHRHPEARFVLMHIAYPYSDELLAIAKHFPNVWVDLCWAWSIDPLGSCEFVRRFLHTVPANKLFAFGGDTVWPTNVVASAVQARRWLGRALAAEIDAGDLTEAGAISLAERLMRGNQYACFELGDAGRKR
jgi:hypothetical protein